MVIRLALCTKQERALHLGGSMAPSSGAGVPGSTLAFRETTLTTSLLLARIAPPGSSGRASGNYPKGGMGYAFCLDHLTDYRYWSRHLGTRSTTGRSEHQTAN